MSETQDALLLRLSAFAKELHQEGHAFYIKVEVSKPNGQQIIEVMAEQGEEIHINNRVYSDIKEEPPIEEYQVDPTT